MAVSLVFSLAWKRAVAWSRFDEEKSTRKNLILFWVDDKWSQFKMDFWHPITLLEFEDISSWSNSKIISRYLLGKLGIDRRELCIENAVKSYALSCNASRKYRCIWLTGTYRRQVRDQCETWRFYFIFICIQLDIMSRDSVMSSAVCTPLKDRECIKSQIKMIVFLFCVRSVFIRSLMELSDYHC